MAFQILNQSVDTIDFTPIHTANCIGDFNNINSGTEYLSEIVFGIKDFFPEFQKKNTSNQSQYVKHISIKIVQATGIDVLVKSYTAATVFAYPTDEKHSFLFLKDVTPQPPKA